VRQLLVITLLIASVSWILLIPVNPGHAASISTQPQLIMIMRRNAATLDISGNVSSTAHEIILQQSAQRFFTDQNTNIDFDRADQAPPGWALVTELVLRAIAHTELAEVRITPTSVSINGLTADPKSYEEAKQRVDAVLLAGMTMTSNVSGINAAASFGELCQNRFTQTASSGRVEFTMSTANFTDDAVPMLDALIEIAVDCPDTIIRVTGHTDSSGDPVSNMALGQARATRIVEYMVSRGLPISRFETNVAFSENVENQETEVQSRQSNRRVDFELLVSKP
jgi:OOP family OmpA-OmpF porin